MDTASGGTSVDLKHEDDPLFKNKGPWEKGKFISTHEGGMRVPFFVYWKDKLVAGENDHLCALYDVLATTANLAGVEPPKTDGISFAPILRGKQMNKRSTNTFIGRMEACHGMLKAFVWISGGHTVKRSFSSDKAL